MEGPSPRQRRRRRGGGGGGGGAPPRLAAGAQNNAPRSQIPEGLAVVAQWLVQPCNGGGVPRALRAACSRLRAAGPPPAPPPRGEGPADSLRPSYLRWTLSLPGARALVRRLRPGERERVARAVGRAGCVELLAAAVAAGCVLEETFEAAAAAGRLEFMKVMVAFGQGSRCGPCSAELAARAGHILMFRWIMTNSPIEDHTYNFIDFAEMGLCGALENGNEMMVREAMKFAPNKETLMTACNDVARNGCLAGLKAAQRLKAFVSISSGNALGLMDHAAHSGNLRLVRWLRGVLADASPMPTVLQMVAETAAARGHWPIVTWAFEQLGGEALLDASICSSAADQGDRRMLEWARANGAEWDHRVCVAAARRGDVDLFLWALRAGCPWEPDSCFHDAVCYGHTEMSRTLWDVATGQGADLRGCLTPILCAAAVEAGNSELLAFLRERRCPWDETACEQAAQIGDLPLLQRLREEGCPWDGYTTTAAAATGRVRLLRWAVEHGCPVGEEAPKGAATNGHVAALRFLLLETDCPRVNKYLLCAAAVEGHLDVLQFLHFEAGVPVRRDDLNTAEVFGHKHVLDWAELLPEGQRVVE